MEQAKARRTTNWSSSRAIPGAPNRLDTVAALHYHRDIGSPITCNGFTDLEVLLTAWGARSDENARRAREMFFGVAQ